MNWIKKYIKKTPPLGAWGLILLLMGCENYLGGDINIDPSRTTENNISLQGLMSTVIFYTSDSHFGAAWVANRYTQQIGDVVADGIDVQREQSVPAVWTNVYLNIIPNLNVMLRKAQEQNQPFYTGTAKILMAMNLALATSLWENIPYSQADKGTEGIFRPSFDTQEQIFRSVQTLLDEGIAALQPISTQTTARPDDLAYNGNVARWIRLAWTLKARYLMQLSRKGATNAANAALTALANGFQSNADDFQLIYTSRNFNPWHSNVALANNTGNFTITHSAYLINMMNGSGGGILDPRLPLIASRPATATTWVGVTAGRGTGSGSNVNFSTTTWQSTQTAPIQMCTFAEAKFLEAEARFIANGGNTTSRGTTTAAYAAWQEAIRANMTKLGVSATDANAYLNNPTINIGAANLTLANIMMEKYKTLFLHPEVWNDMRRYDYNTNVYRGLTLPENHSPDLQGRWIQRMSYPSSENSRNTDNVRANFKAISVPMWMFSN
ncbi:MAG: SusD/RagB family nutrient-binding outer membrane lipoprotein [Runella sp.]